MRRVYMPVKWFQAAVGREAKPGLQGIRNGYKIIRTGMCASAMRLATDVVCRLILLRCTQGENKYSEGHVFGASPA